MDLIANTGIYRFSMSSLETRLHRRGEEHALEAGLDILPANIRLAEAELAFAGRIGRRIC